MHLNPESFISNKKQTHMYNRNINFNIVKSELEIMASSFPIAKPSECIFNAKVS